MLQAACRHLVHTHYSLPILCYSSYGPHEPPVRPEKFVHEPAKLIMSPNETGTSIPKSEPSYLKRLSPDQVNALYVRIVDHLTRGKRYRDPTYTAGRLAADLQTNTRYIAAAVSLSTGGNYSALVNGFRLRDACNMLASHKFRDMSIEEIGLLAGYASRQAFYLAFNRTYHCTPKTYRKQFEK